MKPSKKKIPYLFFLILLAIPLLLVRINENFVVFSDGLIYEEISYRMAKTNNFLTPVFQGEAWLTKPPLYFWLTAPLYKFFSPLPWVRRVWSVVPAFFLIITTYFLARLTFRPLTAFLAGLILLTNYYFFVFTKAGNLDILSTLFLSLSLYAYLKYQKKWFWPIMAAAAFGLAILTRSFLALSLLPLMGIDLLSQKRSSPGKNNDLILLFLVITIILAIILPWHLKIALKFPQKFWQDYIFFNSLHRFRADSYPLRNNPLSPSMANSLIYILSSSLIFLLLPIAITQKIIAWRKTSRLEFFLIGWLFVFSLVFLPLLISRTAYAWFFLQILPAVSILSASFFSQKILPFLSQATSLKNWLIISLLLLNFAAGPILFLRQKDPSVEIVKTVRLANQISGPKEPLYSWQQQHFSSTLFFNPDKPFITIEASGLKAVLEKQEEILIFVAKVEVHQFPKEVSLEKIASFGQGTLFRAHYSK